MIQAALKLKVQKPRVEMSNDGESLWLFYARDRKPMFQIPRSRIPSEVVNHMADSATGLKCFISATVDLTGGRFGQLSEIKLLPAEDW